MEQEEFAQRMIQLRYAKNVSARDMSLSLGQSSSYINGIENGAGFPSMTTFFYICDYFGITPAEFFDTSIPAPGKLRELLDAAKGLSNEQLDRLIAFIKSMK